MRLRRRSRETALALAVVLTVSLGLITQDHARAAIWEAPVLTAPAHGAVVDNFSPTLRWTLPAGVIQYQLSVWPADGPGINLIRNVGTSFGVPPPPTWYGLLPDLTYTWRVRASDSAARITETDPSWGPWSVPRSFRTPTVSSSSLTLHDPPDGATSSSTRPTLAWRTSDPALWYFEVQVSKDSAFTTAPSSASAAVYWELVHGGMTSPTNSYTIPPDQPLEPGHIYYWRVRPRVQADGSAVAWTPAVRFTTPVSSTITMADNGETVTFQTGDRFLLDLGTNYQWTVQVEDETVVAPLPTTGPAAMPVLLEAKRAGETAIRATGELPCHREQPPCLAPSLLFQVHIVVLDGPVVRQLAPIDAAEIRSTSALPPEYFADVVSGLPDGCTQFESATMQRSGDTIRIEIWNVRPGDDRACTMVYGTVDHVFALGSDFIPGQSYTVRVNTVTRTFVAR